MSVPFFVCFMACVGLGVYARYLSNVERIAPLDALDDEWLGAAWEAER